MEPDEAGIENHCPQGTLKNVRFHLEGTLKNVRFHLEGTLKTLGFILKGP